MLPYKCIFPPSGVVDYRFKSPSWRETKFNIGLGPWGHATSLQVGPLRPPGPLGPLGPWGQVTSLHFTSGQASALGPGHFTSLTFRIGLFCAGFLVQVFSRQGFLVKVLIDLARLILSFATTYGISFCIYQTSCLVSIMKGFLEF